MKGWCIAHDQPLQVCGYRIGGLLPECSEWTLPVVKQAEPHNHPLSIGCGPSLQSQGGGQVKPKLTPEQSWHSWDYVQCDGHHETPGPFIDLDKP